MKHVVIVSSALLALAAAPLAGCGGPPIMPCWMLKGECISYDQYLSVDQSAVPTPTVDTVIAALGTPMDVSDRNGRRRSVRYHAYSLTGEMKTAVFSFDESEKLVKKELW